MHYFAYGSNPNRKQMLAGCPDSKPMFIVTLPGYKLVFTGWSRKWRGGVATIKPLRGEKVIGAVYEISKSDLRRLNKCEGYPSTYTSPDVTVFDENGNPVEAMTSIKAGLLKETQPSKEYLAVIKQG